MRMPFSPQAPGAWAAGLLALLCGAAALALAAWHPLAPWVLVGGVLAVAGTVAWRPHWGLFLLPALLPVLNFSPWTGWRLLDESDLLVLACATGGFAALSLGRRGMGLPAGPVRAVWWLLAVSLVVGVVLGWRDAGGWQGSALENLYADDSGAWQTLRVAKSLAWMLLLLPLLGRSAGLPPARWLARGMVAGLALVCALVLWEREVYPGLLDFSLPYRTSAWFWEMHVGGGAIDAYLALAVPFAFWAVWTAPTWARCAAAGALLMAAVYAVLTTYSRGIYLAALIALVFMAATALRWRIRPALAWLSPRRAVLALLLLLGTEGVLVLGGGSFMAGRLSRSDADMVSRVEHWRSGLGLLQSPRDWVFGLGFGRLPAHYSQAAKGGEFPGQAAWRLGALERPRAELAGPASDPRLLGYFSLTQRVDLRPGGAPYRVRVLGSSGQEPGALMVSLCETHLLHDFRCQFRRFALDDAPAGGQGIELELLGESLEPAGRPGFQPTGVLALTPGQVGAEPLRIERVELFDGEGQQLLRNTAFAQGLQHWLPATQGHFLPWHIDNLYLDVLIERGVFGLVALGALAVLGGLAAWRRLRAGDPTAWVFAASLGGLLSLGAVISVTEVPRVMLILLLLGAASAQFREQIEDASPCNVL